MFGAPIVTFFLNAVSFSNSILHATRAFVLDLLSIILHLALYYFHKVIIP